MRLTYANILTLSRFFMAPVFLAFAVLGTPGSVTVAAIIFLVAAITDWADGYLARRYGEVTEHGTYLDPLADKVLTTSAFVAFTILGIMPLWMVVVIVVRDFGITSLRNIATEKGTSVRTSRIAKVKTALQMIVITIVILLYWLATVDPGFTITSAYFEIRGSLLSLLYSEVVWWALFLLTMWTLITGVDYLIRYRSLLRRTNA